MAVTPNSFAQYFAVSSLESTLPRACLQLGDSQISD
jgi:hypothetical protein